MPTKNVSTASDEPDAQLDLREPLWNGGEIGPIKQIQVSTERITQLRGIVYDIDPDLLRAGAIIKQLPDNPHDLHDDVIRPMLDRHPTLAKAEVRDSGRGLHVILRFDDPIDLTATGEQQRWAGIVQVVQAALPIDPDQPGITATTRAIGSTNSKNGATVELITAGEAVTQEEVLALYDDMTQRPFETVMRILAGSDTVKPCPRCRKVGSRMSAYERIGTCYDCGRVTLDQLYDLLFATAPKG